MNTYNKKRQPLKVSSGFIITILLSIFFITKMMRSFSGSKVAGGVWNYIQIFIIVNGFLTIITELRKLYKDSAFLLLLLYTSCSLFHGLFFLKLTVNELFNYVMIAYPLCVLAISYKYAWNRNIKDNHILTMTYYIIAAIFIFSMITNGIYSTVIGAVADVYYILGLLPLVMICSKKNKLVPCVVCGIAVVISGKRLGIILCVVMVSLYYLTLAFQTRNFKKSISAIFVLLVIFAVFNGILMLVVQRFNERLIFRISEMLYENDSSGRDILWQRIITNIQNSSIVFLFFGHGEGAVSSLLGTNAHNDFLEILYNFGVFPCALYVAFYLRCVGEMIRMFRMKYEYAAQFAMSIVCSVGLALFSFYAITPTYITCGMICIGYIYVDFRKSHFLISDTVKFRETQFLIGR